MAEGAAAERVLLWRDWLTLITGIIFWSFYLTCETNKWATALTLCTLTCLFLGMAFVWQTCSFPDARPDLTLLWTYSRSYKMPGYTREETVGSHFVSYGTTKCILAYRETLERRWRRPWFCTLNAFSLAPGFYFICKMSSCVFPYLNHVGVIST